MKNFNMDRNDQDQKLWQDSLLRLQEEVAALPAAERTWMADHLRRIAGLQEELHRFFLRADGATLCRDCGGECCGCGRYHVTLANLLPFLLAGEEPPPPDFRRTCPFLGDSGCRLPPARRPFNCIIFQCEGVENRLSPADRTAFQAGEKALRDLYQAFDQRYAGSSLRGFLLRADALAGRPFLAPPRQ